MLKNHQYWEANKQEEFAQAVSSAQMRCFQIAVIAMFCLFLAAWFIPGLKPIAWVAFIVTAIFGLLGENVVAIWLERFDKRFRVSAE